MGRMLQLSRVECLNEQCSLLGLPERGGLSSRSLGTGEGRANRSLNRFRRVPTCSVPRERGVRGAARGLERELEGLGATQEEHDRKKSYASSARGQPYPERRAEPNHLDAVIQATSPASISNLAAVSEREKRGHYKIRMCLAPS